MSARHYKIIFDARPIPENEVAEVKRKLSALLKLEGEKLARLFSGRPVVIRSDVDHQMGLKYRAAFERAGARCQLVEIHPESPESSVIDEGVQKTDGHKRIICPHCHFEQDQSTECIRCGIVISKYRDKRSQTGPQPAGTCYGQRSGEKSFDFKVTGEFSKKAVLGPTWLLHKMIPNKLEYLFRNIFTRRNRYFRYIAKVLDTTIHAILLVSATSILFIVLMYMGKMLWYFYIHTPGGRKFIELYSVRAQSIVALLNREMISFSIHLTLEVFTVCLVISAVCQVLHIARYFYVPRAWFGKISFWGLPLTAVVAFHIHPGLGVQQFGLTYAVALLPTLCVFSGCFRFTYELLPEIGDLTGRALGLIARSAQARLPEETNT